MDQCNPGFSEGADLDANLPDHLQKDGPVDISRGWALKQVAQMVHGRDRHVVLVVVLVRAIIPLMVPIMVPPVRT